MISYFVASIHLFSFVNTDSVQLSSDNLDVAIRVLDIFNNIGYKIYPIVIAGNLVKLIISAV